MNAENSVGVRGHHANTARAARRLLRGPGTSHRTVRSRCRRGGSSRRGGTGERSGGRPGGSYSPGRFGLEVRRLPVPRSGSPGSVLVLLHLLPHFQTGPVTSGGSRLRLPDARGRCAPRGGSTRPPIRKDPSAYRALAPGGNPPTGPRRPRLGSEFRTDGFPGGSLLSGHVVAAAADRAFPTHGPAAGAEQPGRVPGRRPENLGLSRSRMSRKTPFLRFRGTLRWIHFHKHPVCSTTEQIPT